MESCLKEKYIEREVAAGGLADDTLIRVIAGPRRAGKSFFGIHLLHETGPFGYVNFDDERLTAVSDYDEIITAVNAVYNQPWNGSEPAASSALSRSGNGSWRRERK